MPVNNPTKDILSIDDKNTSPQYPVSWYQVAWSKELPKKGIRSITVCGTDLVLFRGEDGTAHVLDAYCPHLGAHLGVKGKVCGNHIKCAFHNWEFDGDGKCKKIPFVSAFSSKIKTRSWKVIERYGIIFLHFNPQNLAIDEDGVRIPILDSGKWSNCVSKRHEIHTRQSDVLENGIDIGHFTSVHGVPMNGPQFTENENGTLMFQHRTITKRLGIAFNTNMEISYINPGLQIIYLDSVLGKECVALSSVMPVRENLVIAHLSVQASEGFSTLWTSFLTRILAYCINTTFSEDIPIWDNKIYRAKPVLAKGEYSIPIFRKWYRRFPTGYTE